jgi:delta1-piperideine-2-carboxylate reductase
MSTAAQPSFDPQSGQLDGPPNLQVPIDEAVRSCQRALQRAGYSSQHAQVITDHLVDAELRGHPNAGLARALSIIEFLQSSGTKAHGNLETSRDGPTSAHLDGHDSVGYIVAHEATRLAIEKAKKVGVSVVGANNFWYTGNLSYYAEMATREDLVIFIASNGTLVVAPHGGYEPKFCTNPFCIGFPTNEVDKPVIWDIGTSNIMYAQVKLAERIGATLPEGSAYDKYGNPTTDPLKALDGALTIWGGHKGSGFAMMVQLLGIAAGSQEPAPLLSGFGLLIMAFDPSLLQPIGQVKARSESFVDAIHSTKMVDGQPPARMPFERSIESRRLARESAFLTVPEQVMLQLGKHAGI